MSLVPKWLARFPKHSPRSSDFFSLGKFFEDFEDEMVNIPSGLSVSSDEKCVYIDAHVPGLTAKEVNVSIDSDRILWITGSKKEEKGEKDKKFYRRSQSSFSYCIPLWEEIDSDSEPEAVCKDGVMRISFLKRKEKQVEMRKIPVKE